MAHPSVVRGARNLIKRAESILTSGEPENGNWIKGAEAREKRGAKTILTGADPKATCFCSIGALNRAITESGSKVSREVIYEANERLTAAFNGDIVQHNDRRSTTMPQVLNAFALAQVL